ncbi:hypothetical protein DVH02_02815 [Streptomyces corynorhini]|uniref:ATP-binding protein n=1 Tax=Streptomyces corynorhini TaxID=2282652 RepID=A0A370BIM5_9ACTN|nr:hypothetical protein DVH02_02815 [Streptomyces corynorhini]
MNVQRILTAAAAGSALLAAVAPAALAAPGDLGSTLNSTAQTAVAVGTEAKPVLDAVAGDKVNKKVGAVKSAVQAGSDAVKAGNDLLN